MIIWLVGLLIIGLFPQILWNFVWNWEREPTRNQAIQIQSLVRDVDGVVSAYVQNFGDNAQVLSSVYVNDVADSPVTPLPITLNPDQTAKIVLSGNYSGLTKVIVKVETSKGNLYSLRKTLAD